MAGNGRQFSTIPALPTFHRTRHWALPNDAYPGWRTLSLGSRNRERVSPQPKRNNIRLFARSRPGGEDDHPPLLVSPSLIKAATRINMSVTTIQF